MKKGFTLIELLAVIIIISIIVLIAIPIIFGAMENAKKSAMESDAKLIIDAIEKKKIVTEDFDITKITKDNFTDLLNLKDTNYEDISVSLDDNNTYVIIIGDNKFKGFKACGTYFNMAVVDSEDTETCVISTSTGYVDATGANSPALYEGLIPVVYDFTDNRWEKADISVEWYDYAIGNWANAVTVNTSGSGTDSDGITRRNRADYISSAAGTPISIDDINMMFVWIPRYSYTIKGNGTSYFGVGGTSISNPGSIDIKFIPSTTNESGTAQYTGATAENWRTN